MKVVITSDELDLLQKQEIIKTQDAFSEIKPASFQLILSEDRADEIRDKCGEILQLIGFDASYDLTESGKLLESLIDKFYTG